MYPEQAYADFREAVAAWLGARPAQIVPGHGIQSLVAAVAAAFVKEGSSAVVPAPTYGLYAQVFAAAGAAVERVPLRPDLGIDLEALAATARRTGARLVIVCDPNNPTGAVVSAAEWSGFLDALPPGCVAVVDEAYGEYVDPALRIRREDDVDAGRPVLLLRTFSKIFGLAGLRLGYAVASEELADFLHVVQEPFNVNRAALAAGRASLAVPGLVDERRGQTAEARELLTRLLAEAGARPLRVPRELRPRGRRRGRSPARRAPAPARASHPVGTRLRPPRLGAYHRGPARDHEARRRGACRRDPELAGHTASGSTWPRWSIPRSTRGRMRHLTRPGQLTPRRRRIS